MLTLLIIGMLLATPATQSTSATPATPAKSATLASRSAVVSGFRAVAQKSRFSGKWQYSTSAHWHKGRCPAPRKGKGVLRFSRKGSKATLTIVSGMTCRPKGMCTCTGKIKGKQFHCKKTMKVDNEGGKAHNTIKLTQTSGNKMKGSVRSGYAHPSGFKCSWGFKLTVKKK